MLKDTKKQYAKATRTNIMSVKEIGYAHKIHNNKYIDYDPNKPIITSMREKDTSKYVNAHIQSVAIKFSRM